MSPLRIFALLLISFTLVLYLSSRYLRKDVAHAGASSKQVEQFATSSVEGASLLYNSGATTLTLIASTLSDLHSSFWSGAQELEQNLTQLATVEFQGQYYLEEALLRRLAQVETNPGVFEVSLKERLAALQAHPWVEQVESKWQVLPPRLFIEISEAEPWIVAEYAGHSWLLSRKRKLLSPLAMLTNPTLIERTSAKGRIDGLADTPGAENYLSSENARLEYATKMVSLLEMAKVFTFPIDRFSLRSDGSLLVTPRPPSTLPSVRVNVHSLGEAQRVALQLREVLQDLEKREETAVELDFRFQPQVIVR